MRFSVLMALLGCYLLTCYADPADDPKPSGTASYREYESLQQMDHDTYCDCGMLDPVSQEDDTGPQNDPDANDYSRWKD
jgi:hypothetical protein